MEDMSILSQAALGTIIFFAVFGVIPYAVGALIHWLANKCEARKAKTVIL